MAARQFVQYGQVSGLHVGLIRRFDVSHALLVVRLAYRSSSRCGTRERAGKSTFSSKKRFESRQWKQTPVQRDEGNDERCACLGSRCLLIAWRGSGMGMGMGMGGAKEERRGRSLLSFIMTLGNSAFRKRRVSRQW